MRTVAVLPVKSFGHAKQRLGARLGDDQRAALADAMVGDVLAALGAIDGLAGLVVVTAERRARALAEAAGADVVHDDREAGQSAAALLGLEHAVKALHAARVLLVPGDCPALDADEVGALLAEPPVRVVIVPDRHGSGTNALLLAPPAAVVPSFGPGSLARHAALARAAGALPRIAPVLSLGLDVDTPDDLSALRVALEALPGGRAQRTRAALQTLIPLAA